jgi:zinc-binding alcohol dehydrogenase/oxidoreductase
MNAIILTDLHQPLRLTEAKTPTAGPGEVIVSLRAAAINHRDVFIQAGRYPGIKLPGIPGSDGAGVVTEVGDGTDPAWLGREVVINCSLNWGSNPDFYGPDFQILGMPTNGTFAECLQIDARYIYDKPTHLSFAEAAAVPLAGMTAWRALMSRARLQPHRSDRPERVLVTGIGAGTALFAMQFALAQGAEVWVTSGSPEKIEKAVALGAAGGVNYKDEDWQKQLMARTGGGRGGYFEVIIDSAGGPGFAKLIDVAAPGARIAFFGGTTGNITDLVPGKMFFKQLSIFGSTMASDAEFAAMLNLINQTKLRPVIDERFPLTEAEQALRRMDAGQQFGKIILEM